MKTLKKDKNVFFFDIDGTLAKGKDVPSSSVVAINELRQRGDYVFICTGRHYRYASTYFHQYVDGFVTCNGRYVVYKDETLLDEPLLPLQIQRYIEVMRKYGCGFGFLDHHQGYLEIKDQKLRQEAIDSYFQDYYCLNFQDSQVTGYMFDMYFPSHKAFIEVQEELKNEVILNVHFPHPSADATILGVDKGDGIDCVLDYFQIPKENAYAFGDGANDLCMFKHVGHSIAMGNAIESLKKEADYVTTSLLDDGVYNALKYYQLIDS